MMRSRLRRPTSKSITAVLWPRAARPVEKLALEVVLPTPPLPDVTTIILATKRSFTVLAVSAVEGLCAGCRRQRRDRQPVADQLNLRRLARQVIREAVVEGAVHARDRHQFRLHR